MLLRQVNIVGTKHLSDILIRKDKIQAIGKAGEPGSERDDLQLLLPQAIVFPGLINSHDHLDFNLFPRLGNRIYKNYTEWGKDIHRTNRDAIDRVLRIPQALRTQWGIYKNLLNGVTTVVNHGRHLPVTSELITVFQRARNLHSPAFEKNWKWKLNFPASGTKPIVMHLGEGTDQNAHNEINRFIRWNFFKKKIIAIHGVAMTPRQAASFRALIWCPASNYFLLNKTAAVKSLDREFPVMLGTDSTLTAGWNFWEHLRLAREQHMVQDEALLDMIGSVPAKAWNLCHPGRLIPGSRADLVVAAGKNDVLSMDRFYDLNPEDLLLVIHRGHIRLFDAGLLTQLEDGLPMEDFSLVRVRGSLKYIKGDLPGLMSQIRAYDPSVQFPVEAG
jgi:cytosine/adenosine deaminase-related metal-dependent hydrolase